MMVVVVVVVVVAVVVVAPAAGTSFVDEVARLRMFYPVAAKRVALTFFAVPSAPSGRDSTWALPYPEASSVKASVVGGRRVLLDCFACVRVGSCCCCCCCMCYCFRSCWYCCCCGGCCCFAHARTHTTLTHTTQSRRDLLSPLPALSKTTCRVHPRCWAQSSRMRSGLCAGRRRKRCRHPQRQQQPQQQGQLRLAC